MGAQLFGGKFLGAKTKGECKLGVDRDVGERRRPVKAKICLALRSAHTKRDTVKGLQSSMGVETIAAGDGYNDLEMIRASKAGFLFRAPEKIKVANPDVRALEEYDELYEAIMEAMQK